MNELNICFEKIPDSKLTACKNEKTEFVNNTEIIGDIDELIFPDDELPYVSQR